MKKNYLLFSLFFLIVHTLTAQIVNIPDADFKAALTSSNVVDSDNNGSPDSDADLNNDGEIQVSEAQSVSSLFLNSATVTGNISSLVGLEEFSNLNRLVVRRAAITDLDLSQNLALEDLNIGENSNLNVVNLQSNVNLKKLFFSESNVTNLDLSQNTALEELNIMNNSSFSGLNLQSNVNLKKFDCSQTTLSSLDLSQNIALEELDISFNYNLSTLDLQSNINLKRLDCHQSSLSSLLVANLPNLEYIRTGVSFAGNQNNLTSLDLSGCIGLQEVKIDDSGIQTLLLPTSSTLETFTCFFNPIQSIDFLNNTLLETITCSENSSLTSIDISGATGLKNLNVAFSGLQSLDISNNPLLERLSVVGDSQLTNLNLKNGTLASINPSFLNFAAANNLEYVCADENAFGVVNSRLQLAGLTDVILNTYCSFTPGGTFYTVEGAAILDTDFNGCDMNDAAFSNLSFSITSGSDTGIFTANASGNYTIPFSEGMYTITPQLENPSYFTVSPTSISVNFPMDASPTIQDFCISPSGTYNDLEIAIIPLEEARPGFDTDYKIVYKNKGTTTLFGSISLAFEDDFMDVVSVNPMPDTQSTGNLSWNYTNLAPFETREILYTMNLNTPTDATFPLNDGDDLTFTVMAPITVDETPEDNTMVLEQIVVNSFDPNDKTCLEGDEITEDEVGKYVHYLIRFENLGTASAVNVMITDEIDATSFDINTLTVLDGSHEFVTRSTGQTVEFYFENINLPFDDANNDGYVLFKIKTLASLALNDTFMNKAAIYFDFNAPVITNDETTTVVEPLSVNEANLDVTIEAFPKPAVEMLYIRGEYPIKTIDVYSLQGRLILSKKIIGNQTNVNLSVKALSKGLYILKATSEKGVFVDKILKQ